jgi:2-dehydro-3-deoxygluconokinase
LTETEWFHTSGITPALSRSAADMTRDAIAEARSREIPISLDLNFRSRLWQWAEGRKPKALAQAIMPPLVKEATVIIGNEEDATTVLGLPVEGLDLSKGEFDPAAYRDLARRVAHEYPQAKYIAFSLRQSRDASCNYWGGVLLDTAADIVHFHPSDPEAGFTPLEISPIVDRVGGGDAFAAGLIYGLGHERALPADALATAVAAGALAHTYPGDWLNAGLTEVQALAQGVTSGRITR